MKLRGAVVLLLSGLAAGACGGGGEQEGSVDAVDSAAAHRTAVTALRPGMSKDEVRNKLGEPRIRVTMNGGLERWTYYNYDAQGRIAARSMIIFGDDGKIVEISDASP